MAKVELKDQLDIIRSIFATGGYAKKWASGFQVGNPDLICALPGVGGFFIEVKSITRKEIAGNKPFGVTDRQYMELKRIHEGGGFPLIGLVVRAESGIKDLYLCPWYAREPLHLFKDGEDMSFPLSWSPQSKIYLNFKEGVSYVRGKTTIS